MGTDLPKVEGSGLDVAAVRRLGGARQPPRIDGLAGMGNYNHFLTVQELIDLVAFLKRGPQDAAKP